MISTKSFNAIENKVKHLERLYGWRATSYGYSAANDHYYVAWAATDTMPAFRASFKHLQGLHAYLNDKLGSERYPWRSTR